MSANEIQQGRDSYAAGAWQVAHDSLVHADQMESLIPDDLELLARAAYMLGRDDEYVDVLVRAHQAHLGADALPRAVRCAIWIGHSFLFRGQQAQAGGWFARAERLFKRITDDCVERGYLLIPTWLIQMRTGDYAAALVTTIDAERIAERFGDADLVWLARDDQARALLRLGRVSEGLRLVEEILVSAEAGELTPFVTGIVYCNTIDFCRTCYELRHVREWTVALTRWCDSQPEMVTHQGLCLVHRAEATQLAGWWDAALTEAQTATDHFTTGVLNQIALGSAYYRQGEIYRVRGDYGAAEDAYRRASDCAFVPQPGMALMRLAQGNHEAAAAAIRRSIAEVVDPLSRVELLAANVQIMLAIGDIDAAHTAAHDLARITAKRENDVLNAMSAQAQAEVALADGDANGALAPLRQAITIWQALAAPYEVARLRVLVSTACHIFGDEEAALLELDAARASLATLGAEPDLARLPHGVSGDRHGLSDREVQVLGLIAAGKGNREIAAALVISEHTVARHVQNIFVKLGVSTRTAAAAFAFEHHLL